MSELLENILRDHGTAAQELPPLVDEKSSFAEFMEGLQAMIQLWLDSIFGKGGALELNPKTVSSVMEFLGVLLIGIGIIFIIYILFRITERYYPSLMTPSKREQTLHGRRNLLYELLEHARKEGRASKILRTEWRLLLSQLHLPPSVTPRQQLTTSSAHEVSLPDSEELNKGMFRDEATAEKLLGSLPVRTESSE